MRSSTFHMNSLLRTDLHAWMFQTALTSFCCHDSLLRTGIAGEFDHIDKRRFVIFFFYNTGFHTFGDWRMLCDFSQRHSHCHTQTLTNDCPLQKNTVSVSCNLSRDNFIWKFFQYLLRRLLFVCHTGNLREYFVSDFSLG